MNDSAAEKSPESIDPGAESGVVISLKAQPASAAEAPGRDEVEDAKPQFEWTSLRFLNLAIQQNRFALVQEVVIRNRMEEVLSGLSCTVSVSPTSFAAEKTFPVEDVNPGGQAVVRNLSPDPDFDRLLALAEPVRGSVTLVVRAGESELFREERPLEIYTPDQWTGPFVLPELTAAFSMPNLPDVHELVKAVAEELRVATGDPSVVGYQAGRARAYETLQACYRALHAAGIRYAMPPASFDAPGQRFRLPDKVLSEKLGTCIETTLVLASLAEQCHLHPVVMVTRGHAYLGCHLVDAHFPDPATDDLQTIRKRVAEDEFTVVETTCLTKPGVTFAQAETIAKSDQLENDGEFECAIDIRRARYSGIRPLPLRSVPGGSFVFDEPVQAVGPLREESTRDLRESVDISTLARPVRPRGDRLGRWQQKLLDLSTRNRLLNVREGKFAIPLLCPEVGAMEDILAGGKPLTIGPVARLLGNVDANELRSKEFSDFETPLQSLLVGELRQRRLWSFLGEKDLARSLTALYRESRTDLEEGGVNTLFLAVGFLEWTASARHGARYHAPILLVPVRMDRGAVADGVKLVRLDEDTVVNETLLELLRTEFGIEVPGLSPLPADASGVDVPLVLDIFRQAVKDRAGWEVRPVAVLGRFSFGKFVMWNDLTARKDELAKNPLVHHLMFGGGVYDDGVEVFPESEVFTRIDPANLFCPMSADSSQCAAVLYSAAGKSFVLHGPPGTGKSQTIANIIAHNLALGRRVLFVSEKKAALDVVHRRLASVGLRPFCLELHSNKTGKADVARQFEEALSVADAREPADWARETSELKTLRAELDGHVRELHREFPNGLSAYRCFSWLLNHPEDREFEWTLPDAVRQSRGELDRLRGIVGELAGALSRTAPDARRALAWLEGDPPEWSPVWERNALAAARKVRAAAETLAAAARPVAEAFGVAPSDGLSGLYALAFLAQSAKDAGNVPASLVDARLPGARAPLDAQLDVLRALASRGAALADWDAEAVALADGPGFLARFRAIQSASAIGKLLKTGAFLREAQSLRKDKTAKISMESVAAAIPDIVAFAESAKAVSAGDAEARSFFGDLLPSAEKPGEVRAEALDKAKAALDAACVLAEAAKTAASGDPGSVFSRLREILPEAENKLASCAPLRIAIRALLSAWNDFSDARESIVGVVPALAADATVSALSGHAAALLDAGAALRDALGWRIAECQARNAGLGVFAEKAAAGDLSAETLPDFFETAVRRSMLDAILECSPLLSRFTVTGQEDRIRRFSELDERYLALSRKMVFARLAARLPSRRSGPCPDGTELGILKRECAKKARHKPIRTLLEQTPVLTPMLKPCFLMSPLSVAQYLPPESEAFDLVVFDEASQIPVWDAIGVLARAKQHVIVGDPKQMPPTNFFQKGESDSGGRASDDDVEDMESILDECIASGMFASHLDWHYRSRHESLIAFSNHYYYGDRLSTFPSATASERLGVRFRFVPGGVYDRKKTRTNGKEAKALVDYVVARVLDPKGRRRSVGIVTFSEAQKNLIEDLLEQARLRNKRFDRILAEESDEPLFVKNLENVQGDERDVILFGIGYAPDADGKFSMNFGPLNRQGGERRLNVAITRAKEQVVVFASIRGSQIDPTRTSAVGAAHLRYFLDYAEKGFGVPARAAAESAGEGLAAAVGAFLESRGWSVERNIGASGCRIDLAVRHPERPDEFLAGILCDGPGYAAQTDARDRECLRASVLRSMGWYLVNAWTVDWSLDRPRAEARLLAALEDAKNALPQAPQPLPTPPEAPAEPDELQPDEIPPSERVSEKRKAYVPWIGAAPLPQAAFYEAETMPLLRAQIEEILAAEAPIRETLLRRRLSRAWGFSRIGRGIVDVVTRALPPDVRSTGDGENRVLWNWDQDPARWREWRIAENPEDRRDLADIPAEEIANAMFEVLLGFQSCEQEALYRETLKGLGFSTLTDKARPFLDAALDVLRRSGKV